jgi:hypothetical protein
VKAIIFSVSLDIQPQPRDIPTQVDERADGCLARRKFDRHGRSSLY